MPPGICVPLGLGTGFLFGSVGTGQILLGMFTEAPVCTWRPGGEAADLGISVALRPGTEVLVPGASDVADRAVPLSLYCGGGD